jgi:hypothetical protein
MSNIENILAQAKDMAAGNWPHPAGVAEVALQLASLYNEISRAIDPIKERLREDGMKQGGEPGSSVSIDADGGGRVVVTFPKRSLKMAKGADAEGLRAALGDRFDAYFETKTSYAPRKNLEYGLKTASTDAERDLVMRAVETHTPTPRVGFKP